MRGTAGFTLLEVLVALVVLGFLMLGLTQGTRFGLLAWDRQARGVDRRGDLDAVDRALRRLIEQAEPGAGTSPAPFAGESGALTFATELPLSAGALPTRRAEVELTVGAGHRLLLRWTPLLHAIRPTPPPTQTTELLSGVDGLELSYLGDGGWVDSWKGPALPALVRIRIVFTKAQKRHWPDIVAAPLRERP